MPTLNKKTDYGLIALSLMAAKPDQIISARTIGQTYGMRLPLLMNVLKTLTQHGLIKSVRGSNGGYQLIRPPQQITLGQLIQALQGQAKLVACAPEQQLNDPCDLAQSCPVQSPVRKVHFKLLELLDNISLADIIEENPEPLLLTQMPTQISPLKP